MLVQHLDCVLALATGPGSRWCCTTQLPSLGEVNLLVFFASCKSDPTSLLRRDVAIRQPCGFVSSFRVTVLLKISNFFSWILKEFCKGFRNPNLGVSFGWNFGGKLVVELHPEFLWAGLMGAGGQPQPQEDSTSCGQAPWDESWQNEAWDPCGESSEDR